VVTVVAPYVPTAAIHLLPSDVRRFEPERAIGGGVDGLVIVRRAAAEAARLLRRGGWFLTEVGGHPADASCDDLVALGFRAIEPWHDDDGDLRGVAARTRSSSS